jgi:anaerobic ribonucleoside-triphosphate reductase
MSPIKTKRQPCEVYSRVTGYLRPVEQWNDGKQAEFNSRKNFKIKEQAV